MIRLSTSSSLSLSLLLLLAATPLPAFGDQTRDGALAQAKAFAEHAWTMTEKNVTGSCTKSGYKSDHAIGAQTGVPYAWGGFMTVEDFDKKLLAGLAAGSHSKDGVLSCVAGIDCSGFVSRVWGLESKQSTSSLTKIVQKISSEELKPGDALNKAGSHVVLWVGRTESGEPIIYEASGYHSRVRLATPGWKYLAGYTPVRYPKLTEPVAVVETKPANKPETSKPEASKPDASQTPPKADETVTTAKQPSSGDAEVLLRFGQEVGLEPAADDTPALGPDYLTAREDGTAAVYDRARRRAVIVPRKGAPKSLDVGHADGLMFGPEGRLAVFDGKSHTVRVYTEDGTLRDRFDVPRLPGGPSFELKDGRLEATTPAGERRTVATMTGGRLVPGPGRRPAPRLPEIFRSPDGAVIRLPGRTLRLPPAEEMSWRLVGQWLELEWTQRGPAGELIVHRVARRDGQTVTLPSGGDRSYVPFADVAIGANQGLIHLEPAATGVKVVWTDVK